MLLCVDLDEMVEELRQVELGGLFGGWFNGSLFTLDIVTILLIPLHDLDDFGECVRENGRLGRVVVFIHHGTWRGGGGR